MAHETTTERTCTLNCAPRCESLCVMASSVECPCGDGVITTEVRTHRVGRTVWSAEELGASCKACGSDDFQAARRAADRRKASAAPSERNELSTPRVIRARYTGRCSACGFVTGEGESIIWNPKTRRATHSNCEPVLAEQRRQFVEASLATLRNCTTSSKRAAVLKKAVARVAPGPDRRRLFIEAALIERDAVLDQVAKLKRSAAKQRHLEAGIATLKAFELDDIQRDYIRTLEAHLRALTPDSTD